MRELTLVNSEHAKAEAEFVLHELEPYEGTVNYPVIFDIEDETQEDLGKDVLTCIVESFCSAIENAGYYAMLYSNLHWLRTKFDTLRISRFDKWLAQYNDVPTYEGPFGIWQYSNTGAVSGIDGPVDLNIAYKDYPALIRGLRLNKLTQASNDLPQTVKEIAQMQALPGCIRPVAEACDWAVDHGLFIGDENGDLHWRNPVTREELAVVFKRWQENNKD
jgi:GH25 family lysozyme M1 (1,4-beta-N-acetylmuramidase)